MQEQTAALNQLSLERDNLLNKIQDLELKHAEAVEAWDEKLRMNKESLGAEISQLEILYKQNEHMLREEVDEKANIIQVRTLIYR